MSKWYKWTNATTQNKVASYVIQNNSEAVLEEISMGLKRGSLMYAGPSTFKNECNHALVFWCGSLWDPTL